MKKLLRGLCVLAFLSVLAFLTHGQSAFANNRPCVDAKQGTLTSALCFLVERHSTISGKTIWEITSVDEEACEFTCDGATVSLRKINPRDITYTRTPYNLCWTLSGSNIVSGNYNYMTITKDKFEVCGLKSMDKSRLDKAFGVVFGKYCAGKKEEF